MAGTYNSTSIQNKEMERFLLTSKDIILAIDRSGGIHYTNNSFESRLGYKNEETSGQLFWDYVHIEDRLHAERALLSLLMKEQQALPAEFRYQCKNGKYLYMEWHASYQTESGIIWIMLNAGKLEEQPENSKNQIENYYKYLAENTQDSVDILDLNGNVVAVNKAFEYLFGWKKEEVVGNELPVIPYQFYNEFIHLKEKVITGERISNYEALRIRKDGSVVPISLSVSPIFNKAGQPTALLGISRDITSIIESQKEILNYKRELKEKSDQLESIMGSFMDGFYFINDEWRLVYINDAMAKLMKKEKPDLEGQIIWEVLPELKGTIHEHFYKRSMKAQKSHRFQFLQKDTQKYYEVCMHPSPVGLSVTIRDIHVQRQNVEKLQKSEMQIREITENINEVFTVKSLINGDILYLSKAFEKIWNIPLEEVTKDKTLFMKSIFPEDCAMVDEYIKNYVDAPEQYEFRIIRPSGEIRWIRTKQMICYDEHHQPDRILYVSDDITELKEKDLLIRKGDKLGVVGQLAAGIAHEIRNPLTTIKGFVQLWGQETGLKYSDIILSELHRIEFIMNEFLMLAKPHEESQMEKMNVNTILQEIITFMQPEALLMKTEIAGKLAEDLPDTFGEAKQIKQVIINLIKNGIEAMPEGGYITISTKKTKTQKLIIEVRDEGIGIPKDRIARLGEPFYSNKEKGTGLGLMVSFKIIQNHKGSIAFESGEGLGTTATISLPVCNK